MVLVDRSELVIGEASRELAAAGCRALRGHRRPGDTGKAPNGRPTGAVEEFGRIDVLINNVGGAINFKPFTEFTRAEIRAEVDRSLMTDAVCCRAVLPSWSSRGRRHRQRVVGGHPGHPPHPLLGGQGRHQRDHAVAGDGSTPPHGIRVVATAPGGTDAPDAGSRAAPERQQAREREWYQQIVDQIVDSSLMKRYGTLDEQAAAICFLASDEASYITGTVLPVAGGDLG